MHCPMLQRAELMSCMQVAMKRTYLDECLRESPGGLSGEQWCASLLLIYHIFTCTEALQFFRYMQNAMRAVNQAVGRIIRHRNDYGAVLLADARFSGLHRMLSSWIRPHIRPHGGFTESMLR